MISSRTIDILNFYHDKYNRKDFIKEDPISIPHRFTKKQDIEIAGLFSATLAWGNRKSIISSCNKLMLLMDNSPHDFILNHSVHDLKPFTTFVHRTFNATDVFYFIEFLKQHYSVNNSLEKLFLQVNAEQALINFHNTFFSLENFPARTRKHIATPERKSTCKRLNMYLRWMVRKDKNGVDFGIWKKIKTSNLMIPLDVHVENYARQLNLIERKQRDWLTVTELTCNLRKIDSEDPVRFDFALFGMGIEKVVL
ncbi:MAG: TIGR02757 family protein [Chitinophagales bacterium]